MSKKTSKLLAFPRESLSFSLPAVATTAIQVAKPALPPRRLRPPRLPQPTAVPMFSKVVPAEPKATPP